MKAQKVAVMKCEGVNYNANLQEREDPRSTNDTASQPSTALPLSSWCLTMSERIYLPRHRLQNSLQKSISLFYSSFLIWRFMLFYVVISEKHESNRARRPGQSQCAAKNEVVQDLQGVDMEGSG